MTFRIIDAREPTDRAAAWSVREVVFIREQGVPERIERDDVEELACHLLARDANGHPIGTARILTLDETHRPVAFGRGLIGKIGRMAVLREARGRGLGRALLDACLDRLAQIGVRDVELSAQTHAISFYEKAGFHTEGEPYLEAAIPHRRMTLMLLTREDATALFEQRRDAWLRQDLDAYLALWADGMTFQSPVHAEPLRGRAAFAELVRQSFAFSRPVSFEFDHLSVHGSHVLAEWRIEIERRDGGRRVGWRGMSVCEIQRGRIVAWREYWNPADLV